MTKPRRVVSKFMNWFVSQHGPREQNHISDIQLAAVSQQGREAQRELDERKNWDMRMESALYAWQASIILAPKKGAKKGRGR